MHPQSFFVSTGGRLGKREGTRGHFGFLMEARKNRSKYMLSSCQVDAGFKSKLCATTQGENAKKGVTKKFGGNFWGSNFLFFEKTFYIKCITRIHRIPPAARTQKVRRALCPADFSFFECLPAMLLRRARTFWSIFSLRRVALQTIQPVISRKKHGFSAHFGPGGAVAPPRVLPFSKEKRSTG